MRHYSSHVRLGDICEFIKGKKPKRILETTQKNVIPYILIESFTKSPTRFTDDFSLPQCTRNDIVMVMDGASSGLVAIGLEGAIGSTLAAIRPDATVLDPKYLYYWLKTKYEQINESTRGAAIPHVDRRLLQDFLVPAPPLETQKKIASILERAEKLQQKREQTNELTNKVIQSVFLKMLGNPATNPMGWTVKKMIDVCRKITDGTHVTPKYVDTGVPFLSVKDIRNGYLDFSDTRFISEEQHQELTKRSKPEYGDILYTKVGTVGIAALVDTQKEFSIFVSVALLKPEPSSVDSKFLWAMLNSQYVKSQAHRRVKGIGVPDLHLVEIKDFDIILPPIEMQKRFAEALTRIESIRAHQQESSQEINELFRSLMHKAFRGGHATAKITSET